MTERKREKQRREEFAATLRSGGTLTLTLADASALLLDERDRAFVFDLLDRLREYEHTAEVATNRRVTAIHGDKQNAVPVLHDGVIGG